MTAGKRVMLLGAFAPSLIWFRGPLIRDLIAAGHTVIAAAAEMDEVTAGQLRDLGALPVEAPVSRTGMNPLQDMGYGRHLTELMREHRPEVLIAYTAKPIVWGAIAARRAGVETVAAMVTGLGYAFTPGGGLKRRVARVALELLYRRALRLCDLVVFQNPDDRNEFIRGGFVAAEKTSLMNGSGIDIEEFAPTPPPDKPAFLMIARLIAAKGAREYAAAAAKLKRRYPDVAFRLVGWIGEEPQAIGEDELARWVETGIEFLGRLEDVKPAIRACTVYVLPSYREGTPRSVLEALSIGRAIITTDAAGCRETVEEGRNGILVPVRDVGSLAAAMERLILDPALAARMGVESRKLAEAKYDVHAVNRQLMAPIGL